MMTAVYNDQASSFDLCPRPKPTHARTSDTRKSLNEMLNITFERFKIKNKIR